MQILGSSYLIIAELPVQWLRSAAHKPKTEKAALYPVWLTDGAGIRAAIFVRCPACNKPMNLLPVTSNEQKQWNEKEPEVSTLMGCENCGGVFMLTDKKAYALSALPPQKAHVFPRP